MRSFLAKLTEAFKSVVNTVVDAVVKVAKKVFDFVKNIVTSYVPGSWTTLVVTVITLAILAWSNGILFEGAVAGAVLMLSLAFLLINAPENVKVFIDKHIQKVGWWADVVVTVALTVIGFSYGPVMGTISMFLGLFFSVFISTIRWFSERKSTSNGIFE